MKYVLFVLFSAGMLFAGTGLLYAAGTDADWPIFHGPDGDNKSPDTELLKEWPAEGPKPLWIIDTIGFGYSGVSIADGRIYTSGNLEINGQMMSVVFCLDLDGNVLWKTPNGLALNDSRRYPSTRSTPTIDGDFVYDETALGEVACFEAKTGRKIWNRNIMSDYGSVVPRWALAESVAVDGDLLLCSPGGPKACTIALDKKTGKTVWEAESTGFEPGFATPYFFTVEGQRIVAIITDQSIVGLDPKNGNRLFTFPLVNRTSTNVTMPIYKAGHLFLTTGYGEGARLVKLTKENGKIIPSEVWYEKKFDNHHGGVVLVDDHVYGTTHNGAWASIHFETGKIGYLVRGIGSGSIHYADGLLYGLSENNKTVILLKPDPKEYTEISRFELPNDAEGKSWAHPVVCGGRLYLRHAQYLYCYDVKAK